eukprot:7381338-Prymnesium_polylepis.1
MRNRRERTRQTMLDARRGPEMWHSCAPFPFTRSTLCGHGGAAQSRSAAKECARHDSHSRPAHCSPPPGASNPRVSAAVGTVARCETRGVAEISLAAPCETRSRLATARSPRDCACEQAARLTRSDRGRDGTLRLSAYQVSLRSTWKASLLVFEPPASSCALRSISLRRFTGASGLPPVGRSVPPLPPPPPCRRSTTLASSHPGERVGEPRLADRWLAERGVRLAGVLGAAPGRSLAVGGARTASEPGCTPNGTECTTFLRAYVMWPIEEVPGSRRCVSPSWPHPTTPSAGRPPPPFAIAVAARSSAALAAFVSPPVRAGAVAPIAPMVVGRLVARPVGGSEAGTEPGLLTGRGGGRASAAAIAEAAADT